MIICCGDALIDMLPESGLKQDNGGLSGFRPVTGGAMVNTACALGRLGSPAALLSGLSTDIFGGEIRRSLGNSKVSLDYCVETVRKTTLAFVEFVNGSARYSFYDEHSALRDLDHTDFPAIGAGHTLHFGGISLAAEPCGTAFETLQTKVAETSLISFDPNIRPAFISDEKVYRERINRMAARSHIVKVSDEDLEWLAGGSDPAMAPEDLVRLWLDQSALIVLVTRGGEGASLYSRLCEFSLPSARVKVVDTVGAGDVFNAGLLHGLYVQDLLSRAALSAATESELRQAVSLAIRVAAFTVAQAGAVAPWADEVPDEVSDPV